MMDKELRRLSAGRKGALDSNGRLSVSFKLDTGAVDRKSTSNDIPIEQYPNQINMQILWRLVMKLSLIKNEFTLSIIPEQLIMNEIIEHNSSRDLLRTIAENGTFQ